MPAMHPTMKRLYAAAREQGVTTQAALAARLNTSSQRVKNWESRGISQQGANEAQAVMGVSSTWILDGVGSQDASASQPARPDFRIVADSITVLREYLAITGDPPEWITDEVLLEVAYFVVEASGEPVSQTNVSDLTKRLAEKVRNAERSDEGAGAEAGEKDGRAQGRTTAAARRRAR
jgi:hypothetical protein